jgi:hypothetical protein
MYSQQNLNVILAGHIFFLEDMMNASIAIEKEEISY